MAAGGWLSWQGVILRWTPLGLCIVAAAQWHLHNRECERKGLPRTAPAWQVNTRKRVNLIKSQKYLYLNTFAHSTDERLLLTSVKNDEQRLGMASGETSS